MAEEVQPIEISIQDIQMVHRIIDLASTRGAFKGAELSQVGATFDKLTAFLMQIAEAAKEAEAKATTADAAPEQEAAAE